MFVGPWNHRNRNRRELLVHLVNFLAKAGFSGNMGLVVTFMPQLCLCGGGAELARPSRNTGEIVPQIALTGAPAPPWELVQRGTEL